MTTKTACQAVGLRVEVLGLSGFHLLLDDLEVYHLTPRLQLIHHAIDGYSFGDRVMLHKMAAVFTCRKIVREFQARAKQRFRLCLLHYDLHLSQSRYLIWESYLVA